MITGELGLNSCIPKLGSMNLIAVEEWTLSIRSRLLQEFFKLFLCFSNKSLTKKSQSMPKKVLCIYALYFILLHFVSGDVSTSEFCEQQNFSRIYEEFVSKKQTHKKNFIRKQERPKQIVLYVLMTAG